MEGPQAEVAAQAEAWWKARFRDRMAEAHGRLSMVVWKIGNARGSLSVPLHAPATDAMLTRIQRAEWALEEAANDLAAAAALLGSATELALRGGDCAPWDPLPSPRRIRDFSAAQRAASRKLREAREFATESFFGVEKCCIFLLGIRLLLDRPLLPGVNGQDGYLEAERLNAMDILKVLMVATNDCVSRVRSARKEVPGGWPD